MKLINEMNSQELGTYLAHLSDYKTNLLRDLVEVENKINHIELARKQNEEL